jgi:rhodanese-related sulfurtransferase
MFSFGLALLLIAGIVFYRITRAPKSATLDVKMAERTLKEDPTTQLIDVRSSMEFASGHLVGARLIPLQQLGERLGEIDSKAPVLLYCRSGHRSAIALQILLKHAYVQARHMDGGFLAWQEAGYPVEK